MVHGLETLIRLNSEADAKMSDARQVELLTQAIELGGFDLSPCGLCGDVVVCIPDGLPMCEPCAAKAGA